MLDACREDDWGQRVCQVIPEDVTLNIKFGWYCLHAEYNSFAVRKNFFSKGWNFLVVAFLHLLAEGVFGNPGMLPSFGLARLAWKPASLSSVLIAWEVRCQVAQMPNSLVGSTGSAGSGESTDGIYSTWSHGYTKWTTPSTYRCKASHRRKPSSL